MIINFFLMNFFNWGSSSKKDETKSQVSPEGKNEVKPCCVCLETKKARDTCYLDHGDEAETKCHYLIEAHKKCMESFGFKV